MTDGVPGDGLEVERGQRAKLYFEAHVTLEPAFGLERQRAEEIAGYYRFRVAKLLMFKEGGNEQSHRDMFCTAHDTWLPHLVERVKGLIVHLKREGFKVMRYKIEDTVLDSRTSDVFNLLQ